jgi:hypothetical protein
VGASAAFPPVFPPVRINREVFSFSGPIYGESPLPHYPLIPLTDGGVYDNCGLEALIKPVLLPGLSDPIETAKFLIVSDGGAPVRYRFDSSGVPALSEAALLYRVDEIAREQATALRSRSLVSDFLSGRRHGVLVSLKSEIAKMPQHRFSEYCKSVDSKFLLPGELLSLIRNTRTSLDRFSEYESIALMYHAYLMTDPFLWCYRDTFPQEYQVDARPEPRWWIEFTECITAEWRVALENSSNILRMR